MRIRLFCSIAFSLTWVETLYISQSQRISLPGSSLPLLLVNQNLVVIAGSTNAANTAATGLRTSISALATGACVNWYRFTAVIVAMPFLHRLARDPRHAG